ncbi:methyltransferase domain-containing protein [Seohaeicola saemankumensis]|uniref:CheR family methyltransferase n=1 Tax=Seohaeicola saemankumensis TaxID=481181 RepID=UPI001E32397F|nr:CheR family methyltransferase [Seohaeicola saemankumensis]MCD1627263.1 methyltransferase domain-containing protein [Seohaeicola saemankumensis]
MTKQQAVLSSETNARFRAAVQRLSGIILPDSKVAMVEQRLRRRVLDTGQKDMEAYLQALMAGRLGAAEMEMAIDLITTNTTSFFRENAHFDYLRDILLPQMVTGHNGSAPRLKLWSAACSEGAEAFTLAMVMAQAQRSGLRFDWAVLGTDISRSMVEKARAAIYAADQVSALNTDLLTRYIMAAVNPAEKEQVRIVPELRQKVRFRQMNLMDPSYPIDRDIDVIFLRNVLIYFNAEDRAHVVRRLQSHLRPGGYLFVGHSEGMSVKADGMERIRPTIFRKM